MNKIFIALTVSLIAAGSFAAQQTVTGQDATKTGLPSFATKVNANFTEVYGGLTTNGTDRLLALEAIATNATLVATELDAASATALLLGKATATSVTIGASDAGVSIPGTLGVTGLATLTGNAAANEVDSRTATALLIGKATATSVTIGASDADVSVPGALGVTGAIVGSSTVAATGYKIGAFAGYSGIITNLSPTGTNFVYMAGGIVTNLVTTAN